MIPPGFFPPTSGDIQPMPSTHGGGGNRRSFLWEAMVWALAVVVVLLIYSNALKGPFVFDDQQNIEKNPHIRLTQPALIVVIVGRFPVKPPIDLLLVLDPAIEPQCHPVVIDTKRP